MSTALKVAVSQRVDVWADRGERRDALDQRLIKFLLVAGVLPVPVPNGLSIQASEGLLLCDSLDTWLATVQPHAVVLSGGNEIGECQDRDQTERKLLNYAQVQHLPVLGICRGMQMMAVQAGGSLVPLDAHVRTRHRLQTTQDSGHWPNEVNSFHNFALANCPPGFVLTARSEDGAIEAMRHANLPWEGWMWHPERESDFSSVDLNRLQAVFRA